MAGLLGGSLLGGSLRLVTLFLGNERTSCRDLSVIRKYGDREST